MKRNQLPAAALLGAVLLLAGACGSTDDASKDAAPTPATKTTATAEVIDYGDGVELKTPEDVAKLHDAPDDFKQFISGAAGQVMTAKSATDKCGPYLYVTKVDPAGFANGGIFECGGANLIWAKVDGTWREIFGGQYVPPCELTEKYSVPEAIVGGKCDDSGNG